MKSFVEAIREAEKHTTQKEKFAALEGIRPEEQRLIVEALNPYRIFHVKKVALPKTYSKQDASVDKFYDLLNALHNRNVTGDDARDSVTRTLSLYTEETAKYLVRVIKKDLDCGAQKKTFKKIYPKLRVPEFSVMLAEKMSDNLKQHFPLIAEQKYDGQRIIAITNNGSVSYLSRGGKPADFCNGLFDEELKRMEKDYKQPIVVDGEVLGNNFQDTIQAKGVKNTRHKSRLILYAFDMMSLNEWSSHDCDILQKDRSGNLRSLLTKTKATKVTPSDSRWIKSDSELTNYYKEVLKKGGEGLILKNPKSLYQWRRSKSWLKMKPVETFDLRIVEVLRGSGKFSTTCGSLHLKGSDENGKKIDTNMGSGLSDADRNFFWKNRESVKGKTIEVECQEMTKAKNADVWSLRFPVYLRMRADK